MSSALFSPIASCPSETTLARFCEQTLSSEEHARILVHITDCEECDAAVAFVQTGALVQAYPAGPSTLRFERRVEAAQEFAPGAQLGRFRILSRIGQGAMGTVYAAHDPHLDRKVALKVLFDDGAAASGLEAPQEHAARLVREARSMARLAHPNVVTVYEVSVSDGRLFMAMEFVDGVTLNEWMRSKPRSQADLLRVFADVAEALDAAHHRGIVHRDVKPQNILVAHSGSIKVTDFGLAAISARPPVALPEVSASADLAPGGSTCASQQLVGTPAYMAPEVLRGERATAASDQFSFGVCLHEGSTGRRPHDAARLTSLRDLLAAAERASPGKIQPPALRALVARTLSTDPSARFFSLGEIALALRRMAQSAEAPARASSIFVGIAILLIIGGSVAAFGAHRWSHEPVAVTDAAYEARAAAPLAAPVDSACESPQAILCEDPQKPAPPAELPAPVPVPAPVPKKAAGGVRHHVPQAMGSIEAPAARAHEPDGDAWLRSRR